MDFDVFISHANEDKAMVARPLAQCLVKLGYKVWFDEITLQVGDSLRRSIDAGLAKSRYGLVVLSPAFFSKNWTNHEMDGLVTRENRSGEKVILPIWHKVTHADVAQYSPVLADRVALSSVEPLDSIAAKVAKVLGTKSAASINPNSAKSPFVDGSCRRCGQAGVVINNQGSGGEDFSWFECKACGYTEGLTSKPSIPRWL